jgi:hypothetical protein
MQSSEMSDNEFDENEQMENIRRLGFVTSHIPDRAYYTTRWKIHQLDPVERFTAQSDDWVERNAERISANMDVAKHLSTVTFYGDNWLDDVSVERYLFFLLYPTAKVILDGESQISFMDVPLRHKTMAGIKSAYFQTLTITRNMSYHAHALMLEKQAEWVVAVPTYDGITYRQGKGREILRVKTDRIYVICEGATSGPQITVPDQVQEQTRAYYYSSTKKVRFIDEETYDTEMASYVAQTNASHVKLLRKVLEKVPPASRCVFPMDGIGIGYRMRPGSISGDRSKHWLTHEGVCHEEALDTIKRAQPGDVIIIMYGASFLSTEIHSYLAKITNPIILIDAHYYPLPIRGVKVWGKTIWSYRVPFTLPPLPSDTITIEQTPIFSDNLLYLSEVIDVMEWTKTIAWYTLSQHGRVTSSLDWMTDFLKEVSANYVDSEGCPVYATYEKGLSDGREFFFVPIGAMCASPITIGERVRYDLEIGKVYKLPSWIASRFYQHEGEYVWSSSETKFTIEAKRNKRHSLIEVEFSKPTFGKIIRRDNMVLEIQYKDNRGVFKREEPDDFARLVKKLYGNSIPSTFREVMSAWYGGMPPQLFRTRKR